MPTAWRRLVLGGVATLMVGTALGCRPDLTQWRARLAASKAPEIVGLWEVRLYVLRQATDTSRPEQVKGQIALTLNEEAVGGSRFGEPPIFFGTYDIDFGQLGLGEAIHADVPAVVGTLRGDSINLNLAPQSELPVRLVGAILGDSIAGRWTAHQRVGLDGFGSFTLRRP